MKRNLLRLLASIFLLLWLMVSLGWFFNEWFTYRVSRRSNTEFDFTLNGSRLHIWCGWNFPVLGGLTDWSAERSIPSPDDFRWKWKPSLWRFPKPPAQSSWWTLCLAGCEFGWYSDSRGGPMSKYYGRAGASIPLFYFALVFAGGFGLSVQALRNARQFPRGTCRNCGYDLRATPDRCPECGELIELIF